MSHGTWSKEEDSILVEQYQKAPRQLLLDLFPDRSWEGIKIHAARTLGIKRPKRKARLESLLDGSPEAYYWIGFLVADGHFDQRGLIGLDISSKDKEHLQKYAVFVETGIRDYDGMSTVRAMNPEVSEKIRREFHLSHRKSYENPRLPSLSDGD